MRQSPAPPSSATVEELLTIQEVADRWRVSYDHVHRLIGADKLRSVRLGRSVRIPASAAAEYIDDNERAVS